MKIGDETKRDKGVKVTVNGQEKDKVTASLAFKTFDYLIANSPFNDKRWSTGLNPDANTTLFALKQFNARRPRVYSPPHLAPLINRCYCDLNYLFYQKIT